MSEPTVFSVVNAGKASQISLTIMLDEALRDIYLAKAEVEGKDLDSVINAGLRRAVRNERGDQYGLSDEEIANIARNENDARFLVFNRSILRGLAEHPELFADFLLAPLLSLIWKQALTTFPRPAKKIVCAKNNWRRRGKPNKRRRNSYWKRSIGSSNTIRS